ncbi:rHS repeat-associated core domain protein [Clostridium sp. CAG:149]|nr:rHS repeat-associated core domain protein [Clostridium sp. CAG:149]
MLRLINIDGEPDTAYAYGNERLTVERFTGWTGYYTYDPRGSVSGVMDADGGLWASYRYNATGKMTFGEPEYNNIYGYNAESYNPMLELQYLRARYYDVERGNFLTEDTYLGDISDPLTLNRYNYVKSNPLNYIDPTGYITQEDFDAAYENLKSEVCGLLLKFNENFGFDRSITSLIIKVYSGLMALKEDLGEERFVGQYLGIKLSDSNINQVFSILMSSPSYGNQKQWRITAHLVGTASVRDMLGMLGLMEDEVHSSWMRYLFSIR